MQTNPAAIEAALRDAGYPKRKEDILDYAKSHHFAGDMMSDLQEISDRRYESSRDIRNEFDEGRKSESVRESFREDEQFPRNERGTK
ncbi:DUF2795 domain-containing protein [Methanolobus sp.]|uniref:DUF2795 domain-containing protein n=1 Tax=Methanolobus sp. TaxID=1874737 RepID=UPI0025F82F00|nr:DUF2795 domain-containing protein [Methanolobus sp.]